MASFFQNTKTLGIFLFIFFVFSFSPLDVRAEGVGTLSVSPLFIDISLEEGEKTKDFHVDVSNTTAEPVVLRFSLVDFGSLNESGGIAFLGKDGEGDNRYALASWIVPERDVVTLLPDTKETLKFTVENRESLSPGGHYGAVLFAVEKEGQDNQDVPSQVSVNPTFSALVFAKKEGGVQYKLDVKQWNFDRYSWRSGLPERIALRFQNSGNVDVTPRGRVTMTDPLGRLVAKGILNEDSARILPESFRMYRVQFVSIFPHIIPGFYSVTTEYRFDGQERAEMLPEQRFFAWGVAFWWGVALVLIFGGTRFLRRTRQSRYKKSSS